MFAEHDVDTGSATSIDGPLWASISGGSRCTASSPYSRASSRLPKIACIKPRVPCSQYATRASPSGHAAMRGSRRAREESAQRGPGPGPASATCSTCSTSSSRAGCRGLRKVMSLCSADLCAIRPTTCLRRISTSPISTGTTAESQQAHHTPTRRRGSPARKGRHRSRVFVVRF